MDLGKFDVLVEIYERKKAITERHNNFSKMREIMTGSQFNIVHAAKKSLISLVVGIMTSKSSLKTISWR